MTKKEVEHILRVLQCIRDKDGNVVKAMASCEKQLKVFDSMKGQLKDQYEDFSWL